MGSVWAANTWAADTWAANTWADAQDAPVSTYVYSSVRRQRMRRWRVITLFLGF